MSVSFPNNNRCKDCGSEFLTIDHLHKHITCNMCDSEAAKKALAKMIPTHARAEDCKSCGGFWRECPVCKKAKAQTLANRKNVDGQEDLEKRLKKLQDWAKERQNTVGLKLFEVVLSGHKDYMVRKNTAVIILATSKTHAREYAVASVINDPREIDLKVEVQEVDGPFQNGRILSRRDF